MQQKSPFQQMVNDSTETLSIRTRTHTFDSTQSLQDTLDLQDSLPQFDQNRFQISDELGRGGMGVVSSALDTILHRRVAIKTLLKEADESSAQWKAFYREAQITAQLSHPSIIPVYSIEFDEKRKPTLIMKEIRGITLKHFIEECKKVQGTTDYKEHRHGLINRIEIVIKICDALHYAHSKGVIHRDLKPSNVMIGDFEDVYVMDWGIACTIDEDLTLLESSLELVDLDHQTKDGTILGTLKYMPPEQAHARKDQITYASDQFTIGFLLFELLTLAKPRDASSLGEMLEKALSGQWDDLYFEQHTRHLDARIKAIILKSTRANPHDRYPTVQWMAQDLRHYVHNDLIWAYTETRWERFQRFGRKHPTIIGYGIGLTIILSLAWTTHSTQKRFQAEHSLEQHRQQTAAMLNALSQDIKPLEAAFLNLREDTMILSAVIGDKIIASTQEQPTTPIFCESMPKRAKQSEAYAPYWIDETQLLCQGLSESITWDNTNRLLTDFSALYQQSRQEPQRFPIHWMHFHTTNFGIVYPSSERWLHATPANRPWLQQENTGVAFSKPYLDARSDSELIAATKSLHTIDGNVGVVGIEITVKDIQSMFLAPNHPHWTHQYILDKDGTLLMKHNNGVWTTESIQQGTTTFDNPTLQKAMANHEQHGLIEVDSHVWIFKQMDWVDWYVVYEFSTDIWDCIDCFDSPTSK